jgi:hypothetical protein
MARRTPSLLLLLAVLAPPSVAGVRAAEPSGEPHRPVTAPATATEADPASEESPPPASPSDLALWRSGRSASESIVVSRARAGTLQVRTKGNRLLERLEEAAERGGPKGGPWLTSVRERLLQAWRLDYDLLARQWPVDPTRGCGYQLLAFDSALRAPANAGDSALALTVARGELRQCVEKAAGAVQAMTAANQALEASLLEAEQALRSMGKPPPGEEQEDEATEKAEHQPGGEHARPKKDGT